MEKNKKGRSSEKFIKATSEDIENLIKHIEEVGYYDGRGLEDGPTDFYCIAREDGLVPCETQCITCLKKNSEK